MTDQKQTEAAVEYASSGRHDRARPREGRDLLAGRRLNRAYDHAVL
ncbi:hypothetical protein SALB1_3192 [Salinisphaera sp. LB1]|nr:hypothetical protein SALB1_3192 [Salinisphaera sp. LB1]